MITHLRRGRSRSPLIVDNNRIFRRRLGRERKVLMMSRSLRAHAATIAALTYAGITYTGYDAAADFGIGSLASDAARALP